MKPDALGAISQTCTLLQYRGEEGIPPEWLPLLRALPAAAAKAYAPYSEVHIGAAVRLSNGEIVTGSNQENAAYPSGLCAERNALFSAFHRYPEADLEAIAIARYDRKEDGTLHLSNMPPTPCGACRQVLAEYLQRCTNEIVPFFMLGAEVTWCVEDARKLLPFAFVL